MCVGACSHSLPEAIRPEANLPNRVPHSATTRLVSRALWIDDHRNSENPCDYGLLAWLCSEPPPGRIRKYMVRVFACSRKHVRGRQDVRMWQIIPAWMLGNVCAAWRRRCAAAWVRRCGPKSPRGLSAAFANLASLAVQQCASIAPQFADSPWGRLPAVPDPQRFSNNCKHNINARTHMHMRLAMTYTQARLAC